MKKVILCMFLVGCEQQRPVPVLIAKPDCQDILCLGDSIRIGYCANAPTWKYNFIGPQGNGRTTRFALENLKAWQDDKTWDIIVFNFGLHDVRQKIPLEEYRTNLIKIIHGLHGKKIFFCTITPGRIGSEWHNPETVIKYNAVAIEVMKKENVRVIDLWSFCMSHKEFWRSDIHYTDEGYRYIAEKIIQEIESKP